MSSDSCSVPDHLTAVVNDAHAKALALAPVYARGWDEAAATLPRGVRLSVSDTRWCDTLPKAVWHALDGEGNLRWMYHGWSEWDDELDSIALELWQSDEETVRQQGFDDAIAYQAAQDCLRTWVMPRPPA
jgi:hypothetical protein